MLDDWSKDISPIDELRRSFAHEPAKWSQFVIRYFKELDENKESGQMLLDKANHHRLTLIYGAKETEHNNAVALGSGVATSLMFRANRQVTAGEIAASVSLFNW